MNDVWSLWKHIREVTFECNASGAMCWDPFVFDDSTGHDPLYRQIICDYVINPARAHRACLASSTHFPGCQKSTSGTGARARS